MGKTGQHQDGRQVNEGRDRDREIKTQRHTERQREGERETEKERGIEREETKETGSQTGVGGWGVGRSTTVDLGDQHPHCLVTCTLVARYTLALVWISQAAAI